MDVDTALLCDAATVREGLLHILGGGITRISREEYPADLSLTLALRIMVHPTEAEHAHEIQIIVQGEDGEHVVEVRAQVEAQQIPENLEPGVMGQLLIPWNFPGRPKLPAPGKYSMELLVDGVHQRSIPFTADISTGG
jgi:Family of unknown function (DUF6941)